MKIRNVFLAVAFMAVMLMASTAMAEKVIVLGYSLPLSGSHAQYGEVFRNAAKLQLDKFNKSGKLKGATVEITYEDSKSDPKEAINIARKFIDDKRIVGVLGDFTSTVSMAAGRVYGSEGMPQLSQTASHPDFTKVSKYQFRNITTMAFESPFAAKWAVSLGFKKFAIIAIQNDWGISAAENFDSAMKAQGGEITSIEYFNPGTRDFRSILTKVSRDKPQAIYLCMMYEEGAMALQQIRQLGIKAQAFGTSSLYSPKLIELAGKAADGVMLSTTFMPDSPEANVVEFVTEYKKSYNSEPNMFTAQAYDAVGIMLDAIAKVGPDVTRSSLRDALAHTTDYPGVTGATTFDPETREPVKNMARMKVEDGSFKLVK
ncbi:ABC transporter substrate-binding protein [Desulfovibrio gilichinskyi]|uniref:Amino acid/amide ABC transporter substrate-binding protein, HAAT family n=1 Tax=Desulfovibrio gilichinskyi TaxID=1519643 RepID=A0A1X7E8P1_9BACT|nr:ABC transporter substrate-binding protein [Desulfovibrio gilichinskyi]SMF29003.1 amino acid/amide ABC transporter substrate-binding protein, HAAT family [Desulfovibrio gilichinskyi]